MSGKKWRNHQAIFQKDHHSRTGRDEKKGKTQEKMERGSRKKFSSAGCEKMEGVGGRQKKMERHCSTGQSRQWAVVSMEEEEEEEEEDDDEEEEEESVHISNFCHLSHVKNGT